MHEQLSDAGCSYCVLLSAAALIKAAAAVGLLPARAKYSRASFLFPEQQVSQISVLSIMQLNSIPALSLCMHAWMTS